MELVGGIYESLITADLQARIDSARANGQHIDEGAVDDAEKAARLAEYVASALTPLLAGLPADEQVALANRLLTAAADPHASVIDLIQPGARNLLEVRDPGISGRPLTRPRIPLRDVDLLVNARGEPGLVAELKTEIHSADSIDLLCAFIKWHGIRLIWDEVEAFVRSGRKLRIITTTYVGATEVRAIEALSKLGAEIKVSYETQSTRLHAKAWLFRRNTGWDTAYVGSSNLSKSALVDGLEWNVRLSRTATPGLIDKFAATFDTYWQDSHFESFDHERDTDRLRDALGHAGKDEPVSISGLEVTPFQYQQEILDDLERERERHGRHRNLVVAATGTGKTVIAALDYRRLAAAADRLPRLLFVAHTKELLEQSQRTFREVLVDQGFGELYVAGMRPDRWDHVFASVQSLSRLNLDDLAPDHFDIVIVDEFHHAEASTYTRLLNHLRPRVLLGLTATPFRADGQDVLHWFDGHIASELSLWHALERDLLSPFHYFGIADGTDLTGIEWKRGGYAADELSDAYVGNDNRAAIVIKEIQAKVSDPFAMRALGFCVSVAHAKYMADVVTRAGIPSEAVDGATPAAVRATVLRRLRDREINIVFAVDLFNEGIDVPQIDTVLMLRPTESATIFLQQLGRGLRRAPGKDCLTVLDFIGQQHRRFRFASRFLALTGGRPGQLEHTVEEGFPFLPAGTNIQLDRVAQAIVLENIRNQVKLTRPQLAREIREVGDTSLNDYLDRSERSIAEIYRTRGSWTELRRQAGWPTPPPGPDETRLLRQLVRLSHADDPERLTFMQSFAGLAAPPTLADLSVREQRLARMLFFTFWRDGGGFASFDAGLATLWDHPAVLQELAELAVALDERAEFVPHPLAEHFAEVPIWTHCRYSTEEILAATGHATLERAASTDRQGVRFVRDLNTDVMTFTVQKSERDYSPTTLYRDYAISPDLVHWETQSFTNLASPTGQRYLSQTDNHVLLFARETKTADSGAPGAFLCLGEATIESHSGERPIAIVWRLKEPLPGAFFGRIGLAAG